MFLKRLLVTALGALGLGGLATGTALGQAAGEGNIPAPTIFDDQIACTTNVPPVMGPMSAPLPTVVPRGSTTSPLDNLISGLGMGRYQLTTGDINTQITDDSATTTIDENAVAVATLTNLGYVIPAAGSNCGLGSGSPAFSATGG